MARTARTISLHVSRAAKRTLELAAAHSGRTLSGFVIEVALREAESIVGRKEVITLTPDEWERFQTMLLDPPAPNKRLKRAFAAHARIVQRPPRAVA
jgi:uncharacterized protein (DUF1778 family)